MRSPFSQRATAAPPVKTIDLNAPNPATRHERPDPARQLFAVHSERPTRTVTASHSTAPAPPQASTTIPPRPEGLYQAPTRLARQAIREYVENRSRSELLDRVLDEELPRYAEALERLGQ